MRNKFKKTQIFTRYLQLRYDKPLSFFLACFFPFTQAFISSIMIIYTDPEKDSAFDNIILLFTSMIFYVSFIANAKRSTNGSKLGLFLLVVFGAIGVVAGKMVMG